VLRLHLGGRSWHFGRRAVDLVRGQEVAEHRAELGVEGAVTRPVYSRPDEIRGNEIGCELHAGEAPSENAGRRLDRQRLREARNAFDQEVPLRQQTHEHALEHRVLPGDDPPDLEQRLLELLLGLRWGRNGVCRVLLGHVVPLLSRLGALYESTPG